MMRDAQHVNWRALSPAEFVDACSLMLEGMGFVDIVVRDGSGDQGQDLTCSLPMTVDANLHFEQRWAVQCKLRSEAPSPGELNDDLSKPAKPDFDVWLLMTNATLPPKKREWIEERSRTKQFPFRIEALDGVALDHIALSRSHLLEKYAERLFSREELLEANAAALMSRDEYANALDLLSRAGASRNPRLAFLAACTLSMLYKASRDGEKREMRSRAWEMLEIALDSGYIAAWSARTSCPQEKVVYDILHDPELEPLKDVAPRKFLNVVEKRWPGAKKARSRCFPASVRVAVPGNTDGIPIEALGSGDAVLTADPHEPVATVARVDASDGVGTIRINGVLECSLYQQLLTPNGWRRAGDLRSGDVLCRRGEGAPVLSLEFRPPSAETLYHPILEEAHSFLANGFIASNVK